MRSEKLLFVLLAIGVVPCAGACSRMKQSASAMSAQSGSLAGTVTSDAEGAMEGVLVSAKGVDSTITVTVVSDSRGRYSFPKGRLQSSQYRIAIRAAGYDLADPGLVDVATARTVEVDLKLHNTTDLVPQLMNAEWLMSIEGTPEHKTGLDVRLDLLDINRCTMCHAFSYVTRSGHDAAGWVGVLQRMQQFHNPGSSPFNPTDRASSPRLMQYWGGLSGSAEGYDPEGGVAAPTKRVLEQAAYLASINLSSNPEGNWKYPLRTLPRPKGDETKVIITQYDLPRVDGEPHDAVVDPDGRLWYVDFGQDFIGRLDPRTGEAKEWRLPEVRPYPPFPGGGLDVEIDREGNPWFALIHRGAIVKFDKKLEKMTIYEAPPPQTLRTFTGFLAHSPNTKMVWFDDIGFAGMTKMHGLDLTTNHVTKTYEVPVSVYGMEATSKGNVYFMSLSGVIGELDTTTGKSAIYPTPTPRSGARRGFVDAQDRLWFAEYFAGRLAMFDPLTKQTKEWPVPVPYADPYDVVLDKNGTVWSGGMVTDYVFRLDPATGRITKYLLPTVNTNIRRIDVDSSTTPVSVWVGENHHSKIAKIEMRVEE